MATSTAYVAPAADDEDVAPRTLERRKSNMKKPQYIAKAASAIARNKPKEEMTLREQAWEFFEDPNYGPMARRYSVFMTLLITFSTVCFVLESEAILPSGMLYDEAGNAIEFFSIVEAVSVALFTIEYVLRFACCPCRRWGWLRFICDPSSLIDLSAIAPYLVTTLIKLGNPDMDSAGLGFLRVIRLVRVMRVFKFGRHSKGLHMFVGAIQASTQPLSVLGFTIVLAVIIVSSILYMAEGELGNTNSTEYDAALFFGDDGNAAVHMRCYGTIPRTFWWAFVTMTTVGYGDCYPLTVVGKVVATVTMLLGVLILALPITVIGSNFAKMVEVYESDIALLREFDSSEDGNIDLDELRAFISTQKRTGALRKDVDLYPPRLLAKYDPTGKGSLTFPEFANLKADVLDPTATDMQSNVRLLMKQAQRQEQELGDLKEQLDRIERLLNGGADPPTPSSQRRCSTSPTSTPDRSSPLASVPSASKNGGAKMLEPIPNAEALHAASAAP